MLMDCCFLSRGGCSPDPFAVPTRCHSSKHIHRFLPALFLFCRPVKGIINHPVPLPEIQELQPSPCHSIPRRTPPYNQSSSTLIAQIFLKPLPTFWPTPVLVQAPFCHLHYCRSLPADLCIWSSSIIHLPTVPRVLSKHKCSHLLSYIKSSASFCSRMNFKSLSMSSPPCSLVSPPSTLYCSFPSHLCYLPSHLRSFPLPEIPVLTLLPQDECYPLFPVASFTASLSLSFSIF